MNRFFTIIAAIVIGTVTLAAQDQQSLNYNSDKPAFPWTITLQGGAVLSVNENVHAYRDHAKVFQLFSGYGVVTAGYDFTKAVGMRLSASYGGNAGANNMSETIGRGFYPYRFQSVNLFADVTFNLNKNVDWFIPKVYLGVGGAHTFGFTDSGHPWQGKLMTNNNTVFGFRGGYMMEWKVMPEFGILMDFTAEAYTDRYDGLMPLKGEVSRFPLDMRFLASIGVAWHLK